MGIEIKSGLSYMFGNILINGIAFLTMPIFTRMLSTTEFGILSIFSTYVNVFLIILGLNLSAAIVRGYIDFEEDYDQFLSSNLFLSFLSFILISIIIVIFKDFIVRISGLSYIIWLIILLQGYSTFIINFNSQKCIVRYKYKQQILISLINTVTGIALAVILVFNMDSDRYLGKMVGTVIPMIIIAVILFIIIMKNGRKLISKKYWKYALYLSIPIIPHLLAHLILGQSDRLLIQKFVGDSATGIYSLAYNIGLIIQIILLSINNAWVPWFFKRMKDNSHAAINKNADLLSILIVFLSFGLMYISPELMKVMAPPSYYSAAGIIPIIIISLVFQFMYTLLVNVQFYEKKNYYVPIGTTIAAAVNIMLNIIFIPRYGFQVAAYTTLISYFVLFVLHYIINTLIIKNTVFKLRFFLKYILIITASTIIFFVIKDLIILRYILILIASAALIFINKTKIKDFMKTNI